ncbi:hypothetical protein HKX48_005728 [Thoreauomyces humboldtii]|nr:hypothetical protein HKX48_005728 [Thoreauomyces humboldtii]
MPSTVFMQPLEATSHRKNSNVSSIDALLAEIQGEMATPAPVRIYHQTPQQPEYYDLPPQRPRPAGDISMAADLAKNRRSLYALPSQDVIYDQAPLQKRDRTSGDSQEYDRHNSDRPSAGARHRSRSVGPSDDTARRQSRRMSRRVDDNDTTISEFVLHSGFLRKFTTSPNPINPQSWRPRFVVLTQRAIYLFRSANPDEKAMSALPVSVNTNACVSAEGLYVLEVTHAASDGTVGFWKLQCTNKDEMMDWLQVLRTTIDRARLAAAVDPDARPPPLSRSMTLGRLLGGPVEQQPQVARPTSVFMPNVQAMSLQSTIAMLEDLERAHAPQSPVGSRPPSDGQPPPPYSYSASPPQQHDQQFSQQPTPYQRQVDRVPDHHQPQPQSEPHQQHEQFRRQQAVGTAAVTISKPPAVVKVPVVAASVPKVDEKAIAAAQEIAKVKAAQKAKDKKTQLQQDQLLLHNMCIGRIR